MLEGIKNFIENSKVTQFVLVLLLGIAIGAIFYPTKRIEEKLTQKHQEEITKLNEQHQKELSTEHEQFVKVSNESKSYHEETDRKITSLTTQITTLKSHQKTSYYKLIKPDGTIEIKKFSETDVDESTKVVTQIQEEFKQKIDAIETKWETIHKNRVTEIKKEFDSKEQEYKKTIDELTKSKVTEINKKSFGLEAGLLTNRNGYVHATYDLFGPIFIGLHGELDPVPNAMGAGVGLRF